jgi:hypothetical protein
MLVDRVSALDHQVMMYLQLSAPFLRQGALSSWETRDTLSNRLASAVMIPRSKSQG